jgi:anti-sigma B factor antagonist
MALHLVEKVSDGVMVLDARGRITLGRETEALRQRVKGILEEGHVRLILNLEGVDYVDSAGLGTLVALATSVRNAGGHLKLANLTARIHDLMQITRLSTIFDVYSSVEQARISFGRAPT